MKKLFFIIFTLFTVTALVFAAGAKEEESVEVIGTIDSVNPEEESNNYTLNVVSEDGERSWSVNISASEFERFDLSEGSKVELTVVRTGDNRLDVNTLFVNGEEFEVDRTELDQKNGEVDLETDA